jgi:hypothetical protein
MLTSLQLILFYITVFVLVQEMTVFTERLNIKSNHYAFVFNNCPSKKKEDRTPNQSAQRTNKVDDIDK